MVFIIMSTPKENTVTSMEKVLIGLKHIQQDIQIFCESIAHLQSAQTSMSLGCVLMTPSQVKEAQFNLHDKLDGICSQVSRFP